MATKERLNALDDGFVATLKAYMKKAAEDNLDGLLAVLRQVLQVYAAERLILLVKTSSLEPEVERVLLSALSTGPEEWDSVLREQVASEDASCSTSQLQGALQDKMGEVVLGMPSGSPAQSVLAEFVSELINKVNALEAEM